MSWGQIKYAINSSIGTSDFKPIDKMLEYTIFPSDSIALNLGSSNILFGAKSYKKTKFGISGKCQVGFSIEGSHYFEGNVRVMVNEAEVYSLSGKQLISGEKNFKTDIISINKNDLLTIEYEQTTEGYYDIKDICVLGSILPRDTFKEVI